MMEAQRPTSAADFTSIYRPDGTCGARWYCNAAGVVLAYDLFAPHVGTWFCATHWQEDTMDWLVIVEDRRAPRQEEKRP